MEMYRLMNAGPWTIYRGPRKPADKPAQEQITERDAGVRTVRELRALQPSPRALRPFPCQPQAVAACRSPKGWLQKSHSWPPTVRHRRLSAGIMPEIDNNRFMEPWRLERMIGAANAGGSPEKYALTGKKPCR
jgi:hypothetical protein